MCLLPMTWLRGRGGNLVFALRMWGGCFCGEWWVWSCGIPPFRKEREGMGHPAMTIASIRDRGTNNAGGLSHRSHRQFAGGLAHLSIYCLFTAGAKSCSLTTALAKRIIRTVRRWAAIHSPRGLQPSTAIVSRRVLLPRDAWSLSEE